MAKKKTIASQKKCELPPIPVGTKVLIIRPHLWSGCVAKVEKYNPETTLHYLKVQGKEGVIFHTEATAEHLRVVPDKSVDWAAELGV